MTARGHMYMNIFIFARDKRAKQNAYTFFLLTEINN